MRKFYASVLAVLLLSFLVGSKAEAAGKIHYYLEEPEMCITVEERFDVFLRDMAENDPLFTKYGMEKTYCDNVMLQSGMYFWAFDGEGQYDISLYVLDGENTNLYDYTDEDVMSLASYYEYAYENIGRHYLSSELYKHEQAKYIKIYYYHNDLEYPVYGVTYYTAVENRDITITFQSNAGEITPEKEAYFKEIVDEICYGEACKEKHTSDYVLDVYTDKDGRVSFEVPFGWKVKSNVVKDMMIETTFEDTWEKELRLGYKCIDVYESQEIFKELWVWRLFYPRLKMDYSTLTDERVARVLGCTPQQVEAVQVNKKDFYYASTVQTIVYGGKEKTVPCTQAVYLDNGYMHIFTYYGTVYEQAYQLYQYVLGTVTFRELEEDLVVPLKVTVTTGAFVIVIFAVIGDKMAYNHRRNKRIARKWRNKEII